MDESYKRWKKRDLRLTQKKCIFGAKSVKFLGHIVDAEGVRPNPQKAEAIKNILRPDTTTNLRSFIGMASLFSKFVPNFSTIVKLLNALLKKTADAVRDWQDEHDEAIQDLKDKMVSAPVLRLNCRLMQVIRGLGAVLMLVRDGVRKPIAYASKKLTDTEEKYHIKTS